MRKTKKLRVCVVRDEEEVEEVKVEVEKGWFFQGRARVQFAAAWAHHLVPNKATIEIGNGDGMEQAIRAFDYLTAAPALLDNVTVTATYTHTHRQRDAHTSTSTSTNMSTSTSMIMILLTTASNTLLTDMATIHYHSHDQGILGKLRPD